MKEKKDKVKVSKSDLYQVINDLKKDICDLKIENAKVRERNAYLTTHEHNEHLRKIMSKKNSEICGLRCIVSLLSLTLIITVWWLHP